jgi:hypothetical protein
MARFSSIRKKVSTIMGAAVGLFATDGRYWAICADGVVSSAPPAALVFGDIVAEPR